MLAFVTRFRVVGDSGPVFLLLKVNKSRFDRPFGERIIIENDKNRKFGI
jgi:hypothetical protein